MNNVVVAPNSAITEIDQTSIVQVENNQYGPCFKVYDLETWEESGLNATEFGMIQHGEEGWIGFKQNPYNPLLHAQTLQAVATFIQRHVAKNTPMSEEAEATLRRAGLSNKH